MFSLIARIYDGPNLFVREVAHGPVATIPELSPFAHIYRNRFTVELSVENAVGYRQRYNHRSEAN